MTIAFAASVTGVAFAAASWVGASGGDAEMNNQNTWYLTVNALDDEFIEIVNIRVTKTLA